MKKLHGLLWHREPKTQPIEFVEKNYDNYEEMYKAINWEWDYWKIYLFATENAREDMTTLYNMWLDSCLFDDNITDNG